MKTSLTFIARAFFLLALLPRAGAQEPRQVTPPPAIEPPAIAAPARAAEMPPTVAPAAAPARKAVAPGTIMLNFQGAALSDVLNYLSEAAGFVIVQEAPVSGTVNIVSRQAINAEEAVDLLNAVLVEKGYVALRSGRILKIVSRKDAQKRDLPVQSGSDPDKIPRKDEMVTQILPVKFGEAAKLMENIRPLLSEQATISANESSNSILLTDTQTNIRRIALIIQAVDTSVSSISTIRVFPLTFADAKEVATIVTQLFAAGQPTRSQSGDGGRRSRGGGGFPGFPGFGGGDAAAAGQSEARQASARVVAVADEQSNALIVSAPEEVIPTIKDVVTQLDMSSTAITETRIFRLLHADAVEMADILNNLFVDTSSTATQSRNGGNNQGRRTGGGGFPFPFFGGQAAGSQGAQQSERALAQSRVVSIGDPRTNSLIVIAAREMMTQIAETVGRLDATDAKKQRVYVHSLQHADAENVAGILRGMFGDSTGANSRAGQTSSRLTERLSTGAASEAAENMNSGRAGGGR